MDLLIQMACEATSVLDRTDRRDSALRAAHLGQARPEAAAPVGGTQAVGLAHLRAVTEASRKLATERYLAALATVSRAEKEGDFAAKREAVGELREAQLAYEAGGAALRALETAEELLLASVTQTALDQPTEAQASARNSRASLREFAQLVTRMTQRVVGSEFLQAAARTMDEFDRQSGAAMSRVEGEVHRRVSAAVQQFENGIRSLGVVASDLGDRIARAPEQARALAALKKTSTLGVLRGMVSGLIGKVSTAAQDQMLRWGLSGEAVRARVEHGLGLARVAVLESAVATNDMVASAVQKQADRIDRLDARLDQAGGYLADLVGAKYPDIKHGAAQAEQAPAEGDADEPLRDRMRS